MKQIVKKVVKIRFESLLKNSLKFTNSGCNLPSFGIWFRPLKWLRRPPSSKCRKREIRHQEKALAIRGQCMMDGALIPLSCGENNLENS